MLFQSGSTVLKALLISTLLFMSYIRHKLMKCNFGVNVHLVFYNNKLKAS
jgi:hypothetical protein